MKSHNKWVIEIPSLLILPLCILIMNTTTRIMGYSKLIFYLVLIIMLFILFLRAVQSIRMQNISESQIRWLICIIYAWCGMLYSQDSTATFEFCRALTIYSLFVFVLFSSHFYIRLINWLWIFLAIGCLSIYLNVAIPNLMTTYLSFIPSPAIKSTLYSEVAGHIYSGIFCDRATAAFAMNIAFAICLSKFLAAENKKDKRKNLFYMVIVFISIFFTGKRTLSIIPLIMVVSALFWASKKGKQRNICFGILVIVIGAFFVFSFYDIFASYFTRDSSDILNGRGTILWPIAIKMFNGHKIIGTGLNTFNSTIRGINAHNLALASWGYHAHNIYIQLLGETGIIGAILFFGFFIVELFQSIKLMGKATIPQYRLLVSVSIFFQILWIIYGFTGNTFYYTAQLLLYLIGIAIVEECKNEIKKNSYHNFS